MEKSAYRYKLVNSDNTVYCIFLKVTSLTTFFLKPKYSTMCMSIQFLHLCSEINNSKISKQCKLSLDKTFTKKRFMKTGCLMTADGSDDDMIRPQGLEPYSF